MTLQQALPPGPFGYGRASENHLSDTPFREYAQTPSNRIAGWSAEKHVTSSRGIAEGLTVAQARRLVGLSQQSAYAFRTSAKGAQFRA